MGNSMCFGYTSDDDISPPQVKIRSKPKTVRKTIKCGHKDGQQECHNILKELFPDKTFSRCRPPFLLNTNLELDLYCPDLGLAVQYNGREHYEYDPIFHKSFQDFTDLLREDTTRIELCAKNGINLIIVPYNIPDIQSYLVGVLGDQYRSQMIWSPSS